MKTNEEKLAISLNSSSQFAAWAQAPLGKTSSGALGLKPTAKMNFLAARKAREEFLYLYLCLGRQGEGRHCAQWSATATPCHICKMQSQCSRYQGRAARKLTEHAATLVLGMSCGIFV